MANARLTSNERSFSLQDHKAISSEINPFLVKPSVLADFQISVDQVPTMSTLSGALGAENLYQIPPNGLLRDVTLNLNMSADTGDHDVAQNLAMSVIEYAELRYNSTLIQRLDADYLQMRYMVLPEARRRSHRYTADGGADIEASQGVDVDNISGELICELPFFFKELPQNHIDCRKLNNMWQIRIKFRTQDQLEVSGTVANLAVTKNQLLCEFLHPAAGLEAPIAQQYNDGFELPIEYPELVVDIPTANTSSVSVDIDSFTGLSEKFMFMVRNYNDATIGTSVKGIYHNTYNVTNSKFTGNGHDLVKQEAGYYTLLKYIERHPDVDFQNLLETYPVYIINFDKHKFGTNAHTGSLDMDNIRGKKLVLNFTPDGTDQEIISVVSVRRSILVFKNGNVTIKG